MNLNEALDRYNEGNPVAQWMRKKLPPNYFNRGIMLTALIWILVLAVFWSVNASEVYIECTDRDGCIHPVTSELIPEGYTEGTPLGEQLRSVFLALGINFAGFLLVNHAAWMGDRKVVS